MRVRIRGKHWNLRFVPNMEHRGDVDSPNVHGKTIRIDSRLRGEEQLEVLIHEMTHAANWDWDESAVEETALDIARVLWRLGYRKE